MFDYPTLIVDDFFKDPLQVRKLALEMEYTPSKTGIFSGKRTQCLSKTHTNFFKDVLFKIISCYSLQVNNARASMHFHITPSSFGKWGWVHSDFDPNQDAPQLVSIIYLGLKDTDFMSSGTSIYKQSNLNFNYIDGLPEMRTSFITGEDNVEKKEEHNINYSETVRIGEVFNRMISYDPKQLHSGFGYYGTNEDSARLTLLVFIDKLGLSKTPLKAIRDNFKI